jgi:hypothetical protein
MSTVCQLVKKLPVFMGTKCSLLSEVSVPRHCMEIEFTLPSLPALSRCTRTLCQIILYLEFIHSSIYVIYWLSYLYHTKLYSSLLILRTSDPCDKTSCSTVCFVNTNYVFLLGVRFLRVTTTLICARVLLQERSW